MTEFSHNMTRKSSADLRQQLQLEFPDSRFRFCLFFLKFCTLVRRIIVHRNRTYIEHRACFWFWLRIFLFIFIPFTFPYFILSHRSSISILIHLLLCNAQCSAHAWLKMLLYIHMYNKILNS
jgi:hypothetical protein